MSTPVDQVTRPADVLGSTPGLGAVCAEGRVSFTVWAPRRRRVELALAGRGARPLPPLGHGYFGASFDDVAHGDRYAYLLDGECRRPDPASRFQPEGPHGDSQVVDPRIFEWTDTGWTGAPPLHRQVLYELHLGTFSPEGTWAGALPLLPRLAELGVTTVEVMPVNEFDGRFGWGYDGVGWFAPTRLYGAPDDARRFVDEAHGLGLAVVLDVVYNHLGPSGNYLRDFSGHYFTRQTEWGEALNFDGPHGEHVRRLVLENVAMWIAEYRVDGLRLDATQTFRDDSPEHIVSAISRVARAAAGVRSVVVLAENEPQDGRLLRDRAPDGGGVDALWNEDWHHTLFVTLTGRRDAYFTDHTGKAQELVALARHGTLFQGQYYSWQKQRRGTPVRGVRPSAWVQFLENHDQVANAGPGQRLHQLTDRASWRAAVAFQLLSSGLPMLFQGQEFASSRPFHYFADHQEPLATAVAEGRVTFLGQFTALEGEDGRRRIAPPAAEETFRACRLDHGERERHAWAWALHQDLLRLRANDPVFSGLGTPAVAVDAAVLGERAAVVRYTGIEEERLLLLNFGPRGALESMGEPLLAPAEGGGWRMLWSSDQTRYDGPGASFPLEGTWVLPAHSAVVLASTTAPEARGEQD